MRSVVEDTKAIVPLYFLDDTLEVEKSFLDEFKGLSAADAQSSLKLVHGGVHLQGDQDRQEVVTVL